MASTLPDVASPQNQGEIHDDYIGPQVEWEQSGISLEEAAKYQLPAIAAFAEDRQKINDPSTISGLSTGLKIYSRQPVMFYTTTKKRQVKARTILRDKDGRYMEIGQSLIIPEDYMGWFEVVPSDFSRSKCFLSIQEVADAMPRRFFTRSHIRALRIEGEGESQKFIERKIAPGSVLETKGKFKAKLKTRAQTGMFKKKTKEWEMEEVCYLKCLDADQLEVMIPFTHKGKFNSIYEHGQVSQNAVYSLYDILADLSLPIRVRLLFGKAPVVPCIFTGMLVLRSSSCEESVIGSTILNARNVLFELPMHSPVKVRITSTDDMFKDMASYKDGQNLCKKYANLYTAMIKLSPDMNTDQKVILHMPNDPSLMAQTEEALRALDLVTDINLDNEPSDHFFNSSDSGSVNSEDQSALPKGVLTGIEEFKNTSSQTHV